jgi:hypothetical protein
MRPPTAFLGQAPRLEGIAANTIAGASSARSRSVTRAWRPPATTCTRGPATASSITLNDGHRAAGGDRCVPRGRVRRIVPEPVLQRVTQPIQESSDCAHRASSMTTSNRCWNNRREPGGVRVVERSRVILTDGIRVRFHQTDPGALRVGSWRRPPIRAQQRRLKLMDLAVGRVDRVSCNPDGHGSKSRIRAPEDPKPTARKSNPPVFRAWLSTIPFCFRNRTGIPCFVPRD